MYLNEYIYYIEYVYVYLIQSECTMYFYVFCVILCLHVFTRTHACYRIRRT